MFPSFVAIDPPSTSGRDNQQERAQQQSTLILKMSISWSSFYYWQVGRPIHNAVVYFISFVLERFMLSFSDVVVAITGYNFFPQQTERNVPSRLDTVHSCGGRCTIPLLFRCGLFHETTDLFMPGLDSALRADLLYLRDMSTDEDHRGRYQRYSYIVLFELLAATIAVTRKELIFDSWLEQAAEGAF
jgi:hypothetical protein